MAQKVIQVPKTFKLTFLTLCILLYGILPINFAHSNPITKTPLQQPSLRTGFFLDSFPDIARADMEVALLFWIEEISKQVGIATKTYVYSNIEDMRNDFNQDKINFIVASPLPILNNFNPQQLAGGYKVVWSGKAEDNLLVVTHKQSALNDLTSLQNKQLSLLLHEPISAMYADILALENFGKKANQVFKRIEYVRKSSQLVLKLFFKKTEVIFVYQALYDLTCELNPQIKAQTQVISQLPGMPRALGFFHSRVDPEFREIVLTEVEKLDTHTRGKQLLALFQADKTVRSSVSDLKTTEQLQQRYQQLVNQINNQ